MISFASRRVFREVRTRENCREYRSESRVCAPRLQAPVSCCTHTHTHTHTLYCFNVTYIAGAAVQSNLELSLSNTSRVLGRCLRSGFTSFLRQTADITGGKRRMRYRSVHREAQIENTVCLRNSPSTSSGHVAETLAVDYTSELCSFRRCLLATGLSMRRGSGKGSNKLSRESRYLIRGTKWNVLRVMY